MAKVKTKRLFCLVMGIVMSISLCLGVMSIVTPARVVKAAETTKTLIIDGSQLTTTATTSATDYTYGDFTICMSDGAKYQSSSGSNKFADKAILIGKSGKYIYNKTPFGKITKFEIYANSGASAKVSVGVLFSTTAISAYATGANTYTATLSTLDNVYDCSDCIPKGAKYFWYQVTNANNSQVQFRITYEVPVTGIEIKEKENLTVTVDGERTIINPVTITPNDATNQNYEVKSSDTNVLTVEKSGVNWILIGKKAGTATITVTTEDGKFTDTCEVTVEKPSHKHEYGEWEYNETNHWQQCTVEGCSVRNKEGEHSWSDWTTTIEATCTTNGEESRICNICHKEETQVIPKIGHVVSSAWVLVTDASELSAGNKIILGCSAKGKAAGAMGSNAYFSSVDATITDDGVLTSNDAIEITLGGSTGAWTLTISERQITANADKAFILDNGNQKTCTINITDAGVATITFGTCGSVQYNSSSPRFLNYTSSQTAIEIYKKVEEQAYEHNYNKVISTTPATCTKTGSQTLKCEHCGHEKEEEIPALGHEIIHHDGQEPTCTEKGWDAYDTCSRCDYTTYKETSALGHDNQVMNDPFEHWEECSRCHEEKPNSRAEHDFTNGNCSCGKEKPSHEHNFSELIEHKDPTCTKNGYEVYACLNDDCQEKNTVIIPKIPHTLIKFDAIEKTCVTNGRSEYWQCSVCGKYFDSEDCENEIDENSWIDYARGEHVWSEDYDTTISIEPTCQKSGVHYYKCTVDNCDCYKAVNVSRVGHTFENGTWTCTVCGTKQLTKTEKYIDYYAKVTSAPTDWSGTYLIAYVNGTSAYVYNGTDTESNNGVSATISKDIVTFAKGMAQIVIAKTEKGGYSLQVVGGTNNGKYLSGGTSNGTTFGTGVVENSIELNTDGTVKIYNNTTTSFQFNSAFDQQRFRYFKSAQKGVTLFKAVEEKEREVPDEDYTAKITQKFISVGTDITAYVVYETNLQNVSMMFEMDGNSRAGVRYDDNTFKFTGLAPQEITKKITAKLMSGDKVLDTYTFTIKEYLEVLFYQDGTTDAQKTLIANILRYAAEAEKYKDKTDIIEKSLSEDTKVKETHEEPTKEDNAFTRKRVYEEPIVASVNLEYSNTNKLVYTLNIKNAENYNVEFYKDDDSENATPLAIKKNEKDKFVVYSVNINATEFDTVYYLDISVKEGEGFVIKERITFSVNTYIYLCCQSNDNQKDLLLALYNYGKSADAYDAYINNQGEQNNG